MPLLKQHVADNGVPIAYHRAARVDIDCEAQTAFVHIRSWSTRDLFLAGASVTWVWGVAVEYSAFTANGVEQALLAHAAFSGATLTDEGGTTLEEAKARRWAQIKYARGVASTADVTTDLGVFSCRPEDRNAMFGISIAAGARASRGNPNASAPCLLASGSMIELTQSQITDVLLAFDQQQQAAVVKGESIRLQIESATTVEEVEAIYWDPPEEASGGPGPEHQMGGGL